MIANTGTTTKSTKATKATKNTNGKTTRSSVILSVVFVTFVIFVYIGYSWWFSDERAIRNQLSTIASTLTVGPGEGELGPVTRMGALAKTLSPDIRVSAGGHEIVSRDAVLGLAMRWTPPPGGVTVRFEDVHVKVGDDRASADVYCTAKLTSTDARTGDPVIDAREMTVTFVKQGGAWLVSSARMENTLAR